MRDKLLQIRVDENFLSKLEYLRKINSCKSNAETVRKTVEKEYRKETIICKGKWEQRTERDFANHMKTVRYCSYCGHEAFWVSNAPDFLEYDDPYRLFDFCPYCGADMRE